MKNLNKNNQNPLLQKGGLYTIRREYSLNLHYLPKGSTIKNNTCINLTDTDLFHRTLACTYSSDKNLLLYLGREQINMSGLSKSITLYVDKFLYENKIVIYVSAKKDTAQKIFIKATT